MSRSVAAGVLILALSSGVLADVDLTGDWEIATSIEGIDQVEDASITQVGTSLTIALFSTGLLAGTIDPVTGVFSVGSFNPACTGATLSGTASADGATFGGTAGRQFIFPGPPPLCFGFFGSALGLRKACGNGLPGSSEACDDGNTLDGDCCSSACDAAAPAGTVCRPSTGPCDAAEICSAGGFACPADEPSDPDGDGRCGAGDGCESGFVASKARLRSGTYDATGADDVLRVSGTLTFLGPIVIQPALFGLRVALHDDAGQVKADVSVPAGPFDPATRTGWRANAAGTAFRWQSPVPAGGAVTRVKLAIPRKHPEQVRVRVSGSKGTYAASPVVPPLFASITIDPPPGGGVCHEARFPGPPGVNPSCTLNAASGTVTCR